MAKRKTVPSDEAVPAPIPTYTPRERKSPAKHPSYFDLLRDPRWQKMRLEVMQRASFECEDCGDASSTLNVHHTYYEKGCKPWEYPAESLHCLCEPCHRKWEELRVSLNRQIGRISLGQIQELLGYAKALEMEEFPNTPHTPGSYEEMCGMVRLFAMLSHRDVQRHADILIRSLQGCAVVNGYALLDSSEDAKEIVPPIAVRELTAGGGS